MMCVSQIIMLYTLSLYSAVCQLYINKIARKKYSPFKNYQLSKHRKIYFDGKSRRKDFGGRIGIKYQQKNMVLY